MSEENEGKPWQLTPKQGEAFDHRRAIKISFSKKVRDQIEADARFRRLTPTEIVRKIVENYYLNNPKGDRGS